MLTSAAESGEGNLLDLSIKAMRLRATVGEVSDALEKFWAPPRRYAKGDRCTLLLMIRLKAGDQLKGEINAFAGGLPEGRRPRVMIAKLGQDGHDRGRQGGGHGLCRSGL